MVNLIIPTLIVATLALTTALVAIILVIAQRLSTHQIEWRPLVSEKAEAEAEEEQLEADADDSKILEDALSLQRKKKPKADVDPLDDILSTNNF